MDRVMIVYWVVAAAVVAVAIGLGVQIGISVEKGRAAKGRELERLTAPLPPARERLAMPEPIHRRVTDAVAHPRIYGMAAVARMTVQGDLVEPVRTEILPATYRPRHQLPGDDTGVVLRRDGEFTQELKRAGMYVSAAYEGVR